MKSGLRGGPHGGVDSVSADRIGELYPDASAYRRASDGAVDDLARLGLVLPEAIADVKARGQDLYASAMM